MRSARWSPSAAAAYYARDRLAPGPSAVAGVKADAKAAGKADPKGAPGKGGPGGPTPVEVVSLAPSVVKEDLQAVGSLRSNESVILRPEVSGRIAAIGFKDGQIVRKGQLLVALDATLNEAEVAQMKAEYDLALSNLKRSEDLASRQFISSSAQETAASNAQVAEAKLKLAQARLSKMRIVAPFDGSVGIRNVSLGDYVKDGTDLVNVEDRARAQGRLPPARAQLLAGPCGPDDRGGRRRVAERALAGADRSDQPEGGCRRPFAGDPRDGSKTPAASCGRACSCACA